MGDSKLTKSGLETQVSQEREPHGTGKDFISGVSNSIIQGAEISNKP